MLVRNAVPIPPRGHLATYRCSTNTVHGRCARPVSISLERLEAYVLEQLVARAPVVLRQTEELGDGQQELLNEMIEGEHLYRDALTNTELRREIGSTDHDAMIASLHRAWKEAEARVPAPSPQKAFADTTDVAALVQTLLSDRNIDGLRELLASAMQAVFVRPAASRARNLPVEDRVRIVWQDESRLELPRRGTIFEPREFAW